MTGIVPMIGATTGIIGSAATSATTAAAGSLILAIFQNNGRANPPNNRRRKNNNEKDKLVAAAQQRRNSNRKPFVVLPSSSSSSKKVVSSSSSSSHNVTTSTRQKSNNPLIKLYRMWFHGLPQIFRFFVAGNLGNLGFFYMEKVIYKILSQLLIYLPSSSSIISGCSGAVVADAAVTATRCSSMIIEIEKYQDGISFFSAYLIQIITTHLMYAFLVYGLDTINTYEKYSKTLSGQFKVYGIGLFGATALNSFLLKQGFDKTMAFWGTTATFAGINYFLITAIVKNAVESSSSSSTVTSSTPTNLNQRRRQQQQRGMRQQAFVKRR
jgi:hypothetical protein